MRQINEATAALRNEVAAERHSLEEEKARHRKKVEALETDYTQGQHERQLLTNEVAGLKKSNRDLDDEVTVLTKKKRELLEKNSELEGMGRDFESMERKLAEKTDEAVRLHQ